MSHAVYVEFLVGESVFIGGNIPGTILAICSRDVDIKLWTYEVQWWDGRSRHSEWFSSFEISRFK